MGPEGASGHGQQPKQGAEHEDRPGLHEDVILYGMRELQRRLVFLAATVVWTVGCGAPVGPEGSAGPATGTGRETAPHARVVRQVPNGRIEVHGGLRIVHLWGTVEQRGRAHAELLGDEIVALLRREFDYRFGRRQQLLALARGQLRRLRFQAHLRAELEALFGTLQASGIDLSLPAFHRSMDLDDLILVNALDVFANIGCSGFTLWGGCVAGGGVLTCRNFDWFVSGPHMVDSCMLLVQHPNQGKSFATVTWPGYIMAVTGVNSDGVCVFLHTGNGHRIMAPRKGCVPAAAAARQILESATTNNGFELARRLVAETSPPASYLTRVVLPATPAGEPGPVRVFEADHREVRERKEERLCVVTNHFVVAGDPTVAGQDSGGRYRELASCLDQYLHEQDHQVSSEEAWQALARVQKSGIRFASLHSMVFRQDPWVFELAVGKLDGNRRVQGAPGSPRRYQLQREGVFPANPR